MKSSHTPVRLLLFDPYVGGHHAEHIRHLMAAWQARREEGHLFVAVAPSLLVEHPTLAEFAFDEGDRGVHLVSLEGAEVLKSGAQLSLPMVGRLNGQLLREAVATFQPERVHALYLDHLQLALAMRLRLPQTVRLSGLLFRPDFHYGDFDTAPPPVTERLRRIRKKLTLRSALRHPNLTAVLTLDPTATAPIRALATGAHIASVPEPMDTARPLESAETVRTRLGIDPDRTLLVLFGILDTRKGVPALLKALSHLDNEALKRIAIVLAGRVSEPDRAHIEQLIDQLQDRPLQILLDDRFVPDEDTQSLLGAANLVLAPYQRQIGSSGVLVRAAATGTPSLSQDYGLIGEQIRTLHLGQAVDTTQPGAIAEAIRRFLADPTLGFDDARARAFAEANTPEGYARATLDTVLSL